MTVIIYKNLDILNSNLQKNNICKNSANAFMDSSITARSCTETSGRGTQNSDQGSVGLAQRALLLAGSHSETDGANFYNLCRVFFFIYLIGHWKQVAWPCRLKKISNHRVKWMHQPVGCLVIRHPLNLGCGYYDLGLICLCPRLFQLLRVGHRLEKPVSCSLEV